ncbi:unnamed protein product [Sphagnum tenellum]
MRKRRQNSGLELQKVLIRRRMLMQRDDSSAEMDIGRGTQPARERERENVEGERTRETEIAMADDEVRGGHNDSRREKQAPGNDVWSLV